MSNLVCRSFVQFCSKLAQNLKNLFSDVPINHNIWKQCKIIITLITVWKGKGEVRVQGGTIMITDTMCFFTPSVKDDVSTKTLGGRSWGCKSWDQVGIRCILSQLCPNCECMYYYFANPKRTIKYDPTSCTSMEFNLRRRRRI